MLLTGESGTDFELAARYFHQESMPLVELSKIEQLIDMPLELLQKANNGVLYFANIDQYSRKGQQGLLFLLSKLSCFNVRLLCLRKVSSANAGGSKYRPEIAGDFI